MSQRCNSISQIWVAEQLRTGFANGALRCSCAESYSGPIFLKHSSLLPGNNPDYENDFCSWRSEHELQASSTIAAVRSCSVAKIGAQWRAGSKPLVRCSGHDALSSGPARGSCRLCAGPSGQPRCGYGSAVGGSWRGFSVQPDARRCVVIRSMAGGGVLGHSPGRLRAAMKPVDNHETSLPTAGSRN